MFMFTVWAKVCISLCLPHYWVFWGCPILCSAYVLLLAQDIKVIFWAYSVIPVPISICHPGWSGSCPITNDIIILEKYSSYRLTRLLKYNMLVSSGLVVMLIYLLFDNLNCVRKKKKSVFLCFQSQTTLAVCTWETEVKEGPSFFRGFSASCCFWICLLVKPVNFRCVCQRHTFCRIL